MSGKIDRPEAARRVALFERQHPPGVLELARHAALPVALDPVLVHLIRTNFFLDRLGDALPSTAEADLLLSNLCREVGDNLFEVEPSVREHLLDGLAAPRLREVAMLLWEYTERASPWLDHPMLERAQQLTALTVLDPDRARRWLDESEAEAGAIGAVEKEWFVAMRSEVEHQTARQTFQPKFDVFLSHDRSDFTLVEGLARRLIREGIKPWLAEWELTIDDDWESEADGDWESETEAALAGCPAFAAIIGPGIDGVFRYKELQMASGRVGEGREYPSRVILVLLPGAERPNPGEHPSFLTATTWVEFRDTLDDPEAFHRLISAIRGTKPDAGAFEGKNPYRGLEPFDVEHAPLFFGREALTERLIDGLKRTPSGAENRFLAIVGASGSGKSSLARAGLMAALKDGKLDGSAAWSRVICRPGTEPLSDLTQAMRSIVREPLRDAVSDTLVRPMYGERSLHIAASLILDEYPGAKRLVVMVDQFEEIFTLCKDEAERRDFIAKLLVAARAEGGRTIVVLAIRADSYGRCLAHADLATAMRLGHQVRVGRMDADELRRAIEMPARLAGLEIESGLVELMLDDIRGYPGGLAWLQLSLVEVWRRREGDRLTIQAYREIGQIEGVLQRKADAVYESFTDEQKELCRWIFLKLTRPSEGGVDVRQRVSLQEVLPENPERAGAVRAVIGHLAEPDSRLLLTGGTQDASAGGTLEIAHEALIWGWPRLKGWIEAEQAGLRTSRLLTEAAEEWTDAPPKVKVDTLYTGDSLAVASEWARSHPVELGALEAAFLSASREHERRMAEEAEAARRRAEAERELAGARPRFVEKTGSVPRLECSISYAREDSEFVDKLRDRLAAEGVKVWLRERKLVVSTTQEWYRRAFRIQHVFLLVLSKRSVWSDWIKEGLSIIVRRREKIAGRDDFCLVSLDDDWKEVFNPNPRPGNPNRALWLALLPKPITDFSAWKTTAFEEAFGNLVRDLRAHYTPTAPPKSGGDAK